MYFLEESNTWRSVDKEIRTSLPDKTVEYQILFYLICIFEFVVKVHVADLIYGKIVAQSLMDRESSEEEM